jgi:predicted ester cyclase
MSIQEENMANQRRVSEEIYNQKNLEIASELFASNWVEHTPLGDLKGPEGFKQGTSTMLTAFPDIHVTIDDIFASEDKVVTRLTMTGTFTGEYHGITPNGRQFTQKAILITQWLDGKEVEAWGAYDTLAFYKQLDIPIPE